MKTTLIIGKSTVESAYTLPCFSPLPDLCSHATHQDPLGLPAILLICLEFSLDLPNGRLGLGLIMDSHASTGNFLTDKSLVSSDILILG